MPHLPCQSWPQQSASQQVVEMGLNASKPYITMHLRFGGLKGEEKHFAWCVLLCARDRSISPVHCPACGWGARSHLHLAPQLHLPRVCPWWCAMPAPHHMMLPWLLSRCPHMRTCACPYASCKWDLLLVRLSRRGDAFTITLVSMKCARDMARERNIDLKKQPAGDLWPE